MIKVISYIQMLFIFSTPVLIRHLWQLKTIVFLRWCLICTVLLTFGRLLWHHMNQIFRSQFVPVSTL
jgi:hypothetical protein